jgi:hypothetical protein
MCDSGGCGERFLFQLVAWPQEKIQHRTMLHERRAVDAVAATAGLPVLEAEDSGLLELDLQGKAAASEAAGFLTR